MTPFSGVGGAQLTVIEVEVLEFQRELQATRPGTAGETQCSARPTGLFDLVDRQIKNGEHAQVTSNPVSSTNPAGRVGASVHLHCTVHDTYTAV